MKNFIVISGSSGSGKTTLIELLSRDLNISISVSSTTRAKRDYEVNGAHYNFISKDQFDDMISKNEFLEYENVHGDWYGTPKKGLQKYIDSNLQLFLELDVRGAISLMKFFPKNTISIFLSPPNIDELRNRLIKRSTETSEQIETRLGRFQVEDNLKKEFDYNLIYDNFETTFEVIKKIVLNCKLGD